MAMIVMRAVVFVMRKLIVTFIAVENQKIHPERIKGSNKDAKHHSEVGKACAR